jgi:hypothetical protein
MRPRTSQQEIALTGLHIVGGALIGLLIVALLLYGPDLLVWWLQ